MDIDPILDYLGVTQEAPSLAALDALVAAYIRRVPWESASRIARRANTADTADCPRWPDMFWAQAMQQGTGGTCFESNYAFFSLLRHLGYTGYLTINDMPPSIACHTAAVIELDGGRYLVDMGLPVHAVLPLDSTQRTERESPFHTYSATPQGGGTYLIERDRHPRPACFTLIDRPVPDAIYRQATTQDYGEDGLFLEYVIVVRVVGERIWRFTAESPPYFLELFREGDKTYQRIVGDPSGPVAEKFGMDAGVLRAAITQV